MNQTSLDYLFSTASVPAVKVWGKEFEITPDGYERYNIFISYGADLWDLCTEVELAMEDGEIENPVFHIGEAKTSDGFPAIGIYDKDGLVFCQVVSERMKENYRSL